VRDRASGDDGRFVAALVPAGRAAEREAHRHPGVVRQSGDSARRLPGFDRRDGRRDRHRDHVRCTSISSSSRGTTRRAASSPRWSARSPAE
jgi:hypothetical protein